MDKEGHKNVSSQTLRNIRSIMEREAKAVAGLQELKKESQEVNSKFFEKQDTLEKATQKVEILRCGYDDFRYLG